MSTSVITMSTYSVEHLENIKNYMLPPAQYQFTSYPAEVLAQNTQLNEMVPVLIWRDSCVVGFFCLNHGQRVTEVTDNKKALLLTSFSINYKYQKRGYAKQALLNISTYINDHFTDINEVVLEVNIKNIPAQSLYKACGFKDLGERRVGKKGQKMILHLNLS